MTASSVRLNDSETMIEEENLLVLSRRDAEVFFRALVNPPPATPALRKAARRFADKFDVANQRIDWSPPERKGRL